MDEFATYYDLFNLHPEASHQDLKAAYKRLVKQWHPDRFASDPVNLRIAEEKIKAINIAYAALKARQSGSHSGRSSTEKTSYTASVKTRRTSPQDYFTEAKRLAKLNQYREAAEELSHAVKLEAKYAAAYHFRGILFTILGFERRGDSDLRRASLLGVISLDYDSEVIDLVQTCDDFKYFRHLLKKESEVSQEVTAKKSHPSNSYHSSDNRKSYEKPSAYHSHSSGFSQDRNHNAKENLQENQRQKQLKKERLRQEEPAQEEPQGNRQASQPSTLEDTDEKASQTHPKQQPPTSKPVEEKHQSSKVQSPKPSAKIQAEIDFSRKTEVVCTMAMNVSRKTLSIGYSHGCIELWNFKNKRNFHVLKGHDGAITQVAFSADNQILFSTGEDGTVRLWSLSDGSFIRSFLAHEGAVTALEVCHVRKFAITAGGDGVVRVWDLRENKLLREILHHESSIPSLILNTTGEVAICGMGDGSIRCCHTLRGGIVNWFTAHPQSVPTLSLSSCGKILASGSANGDVSLWHFPSGDRRQVCQSAQDSITALTFCHQGRWLCGADNQGRLMIWDVASGALLDSVSAHAPGKVSIMTVADDTLLSAGADGLIRQWRFQKPLETQNRW